MLYRVDIEDCKSYMITRSLEESDRGEVVLPMSALSKITSVGDYYWNSSKLPIIKITFYEHTKKKVRRHKKKRISKKWEKKYGPKYITVKTPVEQTYSVTQNIEDYENDTITLKFKTLVVEPSNPMLHGGCWNSGTLAGAFSLLANVTRTAMENLSHLFGGI